MKKEQKIQKVFKLFRFYPDSHQMEEVEEVEIAYPPTVPFSYDDELRAVGMCLMSKYEKKICDALSGRV